MFIANRIIWSIIFIAGSAWFVWYDWNEGSSSPMAWFLVTGLWSAFCGIAYSLVHWLLEKQH